MTDELKECYKCKSVEHVEKTSYERTVRYRGESITYQHEGHYCKKCGCPYDYKPVQTEVNEKRIRDIWDTTDSAKKEAKKAAKKAARAKVLREKAEKIKEIEEAKENNTEL